MHPCLTCSALDHGVGIFFRTHFLRVDFLSYFQSHYPLPTYPQLNSKSPLPAHPHPDIADKQTSYENCVTQTTLRRYLSHPTATFPTHPLPRRHCSTSPTSPHRSCQLGITQFSRATHTYPPPLAASQLPDRATQHSIPEFRVGGQGHGDISCVRKNCTIGRVCMFRVLGPV